MRSCVVGLILILILTVRAAIGADKPASATSASPRITTLVLQPSRLDAGKKYALLPSPGELKDGDAATFYNKAVKAMPENLDMNKVWDCLQVPLGKMSQVDAESVLRQTQATLQLVGQGAQCKSCNWPPFRLTALPANLAAYRELAALLCVKARLEIVNNQYHEALATIRTGMTAATRTGDAPSVVQSLVGIGMARMMLQRVEEMAQSHDGPNLYGDLKALPRPLIDVDKPIANEKKNLGLRVLNLFSTNTQRQEAEATYERVRGLARRLDADIAARQCIEALRHYAATHNYQLPAKLADISDLQLPNDPATDKPFIYRLEGSKATLEVSPPKGGTPNDGIIYEITVAPLRAGTN